MKTVACIMLHLCLAHAGSAQPAKQITIGKIDSVNSAILKETRKIWIYLPKNYSPTSITQRYPVVYLLDPESNFHTTTGLINQLAVETASPWWPEMIVVGIQNSDRRRDLTPTHSLLGTDGKEQRAFSNTGGGEDFMRFVELELIPWVESRYPAAPHRIFIGTSLGGLMVVHALVNRPQLFQSYIAIEPSLWWDKNRLVDQAEEVLSTSKLANKTLFVGMANTMPSGMDTSRLSRDNSNDTYHMRSIMRFVKKVKAASSSGLRFGWKYYPADDHNSLVAAAVHDGMRFAFDYYKAPTLGSEANLRLMTVDFVNAHFKNVTDRIGYTVLPPESLVNSLGYAFMNLKEYDAAQPYFTLNVVNYPGSSNVYDSMGDLYLARGDNEKAMESFSRALSIQETQQTRNKLDKLKKEQAKTQKPNK